MNFSIIYLLSLFPSGEGGEILIWLLGNKEQLKVKFLCLSELFVYIVVSNAIHKLSSLENPRKFSWNQLCQGLGAISISSCVGKDALNIIVNFMEESKVKFSIETAIN